MNRHLRLSVIFSVIFWTACSPVFSQALFPVSAESKFSNSELIVEGRVAGQRSFWNPGHTMIFTTSQVEVYKVFKGALQKDTIEIITTGGSVDNYTIIASDLLQLQKEETGIFYCRPKRVVNINAPSYEVYSSAQGFIKYDIVTQTAAAPFVKYNDIEKELYNDLYKKAGKRAEIKNKSFSLEQISRTITRNAQLNVTTALDISSFSPATVTGGTFQDPENNILTINGSGFENNPSGSAGVEFTNADKGTGNFTRIEYNNKHIISWSDTKIVLHVPTVAGTGAFRVMNSAGNTVTAPGTLTVLYSVLSAQPSKPDGRFVQFNLVNENGNGGYTIKFSNNTANHGVDITKSDAKGTVERAINTWRELAGVNFTIDGSTSNQKADPNDGENIIVFDNGATGLDPNNTGSSQPLPDGVLATCFSGLGYCGDTSKLYFKNGFDVVLRNQGFSSGSVNFTFGPCSPFTGTVAKVDLETVLLHELGHGLNLAHIIDPPEGPGNSAHANPAKVMNFSINYNMRRISPDYSAMVGAAYTVRSQVSSISSYGSCLPSSNFNMVPLTTVIDPHDGCPASFPVAATPQLTNVPIDLTHCTSNKNEDPAYNQLTTDGTATGITNTAFYAFRTNDAGGNIVLEISNYSTTPAELVNCAPAPTVPVTGVQLAIYQVNACPGGQSFPTPVFSTDFSGNGKLPAISGLSANTNYLIVLDGVENTKASFNIIFNGSALPEPANNSDFIAYPNPVNQHSVNVQILNQTPGKYALVLYNSFGQLVMQKSISITAASELQTLPVASFAQGIYRLSLLGPDNKRIRTISIAVIK